MKTFDQTILLVPDTGFRMFFFPLGPDPFGVIDPEIRAALEEYIRTYEENWLDNQIPALAGLTPREAAADPTRRPDLIALLASFDRDEEELGTMSSKRLRAALGLEK